MSGHSSHGIYIDFVIRIDMPPSLSYIIIHPKLSHFLFLELVYGHC